MTPDDIDHLPAEGRFQRRVGGELCVADYTVQGGVMTITHTFVPPALEGRGIAAQLIDAALAHARAQGWKVAPRCSYAAAYMQRHPETQDLLAR